MHADTAPKGNHQRLTRHETWHGSSGGPGPSMTNACILCFNAQHTAHSRADIPWQANSQSPEQRTSIFPCTPSSDSRSKSDTTPTCGAQWATHADKTIPPDLMQPTVLPCTAACWLAHTSWRRTPDKDSCGFLALVTHVRRNLSKAWACGSAPRARRRRPPAAQRS